MEESRGNYSRALAYYERSLVLEKKFGSLTSRPVTLPVFSEPALTHARAEGLTLNIQHISQVRNTRLSYVNIRFHLK